MVGTVKGEIVNTTTPYAEYLRNEATVTALIGTFVPAGIGSGDSIQIIENDWAEDGKPSWSIAVHNDRGGSEVVEHVDLESMFMLRNAIDDAIYDSER